MPPTNWTARVLCGVASTWAPPIVLKAMNCTPAVAPPAPVTQNPVPSSEVAPRTLFVLKAALSRVLVSMAPATSMRPTTRFVVTVDVLLIEPQPVDSGTHCEPAVTPEPTPPTPGPTPYPASVTYCRSADRESIPSLLAVPENVSGWLSPLTAVGKARVPVTMGSGTIAPTESK